LVVVEADLGIHPVAELDCQADPVVEVHSPQPEQAQAKQVFQQ
jgi:hypothetical protein